jgi:hypothetical protein
MLAGLVDLYEKKIFNEFNVFSYLSAPTKMIAEMVADQVAPSYWVPNKDVIVRNYLLELVGLDSDRKSFDSMDPY